MRNVFVSALLLVGCLTGCTVSTTRRQPLPKEDEPARTTGPGTAIHYANSQNSPEISKSQGTAGGVVVLWPRIIPRSDDPKVADFANRVQARLERIAGKASSTVDRRPSPERVCPKGEGCKAVSLGAVFAMKDQGCAVIAVVGPPGTKDVKLVPLAGSVKLASETSPFREPPENQVTVTEFVPCEKLLMDLEQNVILEGEENVAKAVEAAKKG